MNQPPPPSALVNVLESLSKGMGLLFFDEQPVAIPDCWASTWAELMALYAKDVDQTIDHSWCLVEFPFGGVRTDCYGATQCGAHFAMLYPDDEAFEDEWMAREDD